MLFFHAPNHSSTSLRSLACASASSASSDDQSYLPSVGSISSQYTGASTVLRFMALSRGQCPRRYAALEALELPSSPPRIRNGLPSTTSCCVPPRRSSFAGAASAPAVKAAASTAVAIADFFMSAMLAKACGGYAGARSALHCRHPGHAELETDVGRVVDVLHVLRDAERDDHVAHPVPESRGHLVLVVEQLLQVGLRVRIDALARVRLQVEVGVRGERVFVAEDQRRHHLRVLLDREITAREVDGGDVRVDRLAVTAVLQCHLDPGIRAAGR